MPRWSRGVEGGAKINGAGAARPLVAALAAGSVQVPGRGNRTVYATASGHRGLAGETTSTAEIGSFE